MLVFLESDHRPHLLNLNMGYTFPKRCLQPDTVHVGVLSPVMAKTNAEFGALTPPLPGLR